MIYADVLLIVAGTLAGVIAISTWRYRQRAGGLALTGLMVAVMTWSGAHLFEHQTSGTLSLGFEKLQFSSFAPLAFLWFAFVVRYTGRPNKLTPRALALLFVWPISLGVIVWVRKLPHPTSLGLTTSLR